MINIAMLPIIAAKTGAFTSVTLNNNTKIIKERARKLDFISCADAAGQRRFLKLITALKGIEQTDIKNINQHI